MKNVTFRQIEEEDAIKNGYHIIERNDMIKIKDRKRKCRGEIIKLDDERILILTKEKAEFVNKVVGITTTIDGDTVFLMAVQKNGLYQKIDL